MPRKLFAALSLLTALGLSANTAFADQPKPWGLYLQDAASPIMRQITDLHTTITIIILAILVFVFVLLGYVSFRFHASRNPTPANWTHNSVLEVVWTLIPVLILVAIAFPSFRLLYAEDRIQVADVTLKVTGHQWYWSYAYPDLNVGFDSNLVQDDDLKPGEPRLLATDTHVVVPVGKNVRVQTTSDDVIHSWSVPSLGVKLDAFPGRLNETWFRVDKPGLYYGQCSQLCGINHGFMPIEIEAVSQEDFDAWVKQNQPKQSSVATGVTVADAGR